MAPGYFTFTSTSSSRAAVAIRALAFKLRALILGGEMMTLNRMSALWARTALVWFVGATSFGMYLGLTGQFAMSSPHAHAGLLGWVSSGLFAFLYALTGGTEAPFARVQWATHNAGALLMVVSLFLALRGNDAAEPLIGIGGLIVILGIVWLLVTLWPRLRPTA
jgi:hypothetical protein